MWMSHAELEAQGLREVPAGTCSMLKAAGIKVSATTWIRKTQLGNDYIVKGARVAPGWACVIAQCFNGQGVYQNKSRVVEALERAKTDEAFQKVVLSVHELSGRKGLMEVVGPTILERVALKNAFHRAWKLEAARKKLKVHTRRLKVAERCVLKWEREIARLERAIAKEEGDA